jgi:hypothetical protein
MALSGCRSLDEAPALDLLSAASPFPGRPR